MELDPDLTRWTFETVKAIVARAQYEPGNFDFKELLKAKGSEVPDSIRRTACGMANTNGGFIIFGVRDQGSRKTGVDRIVGLDLGPQPDLAKQFGDQVQSIHPQIRFECTLQPIQRGMQETA